MKYDDFDKGRALRIVCPYYDRHVSDGSFFKWQDEQFGKQKERLNE